MFLIDRVLACSCTRASAREVAAAALVEPDLRRTASDAVADAVFVPP